MTFWQIVGNILVLGVVTFFTLGALVKPSHICSRERSGYLGLLVFLAISVYLIVTSIMQFTGDLPVSCK